MTTINVADQMLEPLANCLTPEVAQRIVETGISPATQARIDELAVKAKRGTLSAAERDEYAEFVEYIDLIAIFKAKARRRLDLLLKTAKTTVRCPYDSH